ncbi:MAG: SPOR domain-containing protein [Rhodobacteraceae bacterium]|nr:SPOR domain-containing protein [Paracoccaceae bacterium]
MHLLLGSFSSLQKGLAAFTVLLLLAGCEELGNTTDEALPEIAASSGATSVNRDVERPDVFGVTEKALWDGRPSLGGVWVAYPANVDPERVLIRNGANGKTVIGALFRRERDNPGPKIQLSSDAAVALGIVAGSPTEISIVVLRREEIVVDVPAASLAATNDSMTIPARRGALNIPVVAAPVAPAVTDTSAASFAEIVEQTLDGVPAADATVAAALVEEPAASESSGNLFRLRKPYIQVGTFATESNATALVNQLIAAGVQAQAQADNPETPTLWRVISGPYEKRSERTAQLRIIKDLGFTQAFFFK